MEKMPVISCPVSCSACAICVLIQPDPVIAHLYFCIVFSFVSDDKEALFQTLPDADTVSGVPKRFQGR